MLVANPGFHTSAQRTTLSPSRPALSIISKYFAKIGNTAPTVAPETVRTKLERAFAAAGKSTDDWRHIAPKRTPGDFLRYQIER